MKIDNNNNNNNNNNNDIFEKSYLDVKYNNNISSSYPDLLAKYLKDNFYKKNGKLLDIGCGTGEMLRAFKNNNFEVFGTDIFPHSQKFEDEFNFKVGNIEEENLNYESNIFDSIFSKSVIEHLRKPMTILNESYRLLKPDGCCIIMTPSWVHNSWGPFYFDFTHVSPFTKPSLRDAMKMAGFKDIEVYHFYQLPLLWKYPYLSFFAKILAYLPIPYRPFYDFKTWPDNLNKTIRFSNEVMLLGIGRKS